MSQNMLCPECSSLGSKVIDGRWTGEKNPHHSSRFPNAVRRRRQCSNGHRYSTIETIESLSGQQPIDEERVRDRARRLIIEVMEHLQP